MSAPVASTLRSSASVEQLFAVLTSEEWVAKRAEMLGDGSTVVRREVQPDGGVLLAVSRELPEGVPGFLQRFLPRDGRVVQTDEWSGADAAGVRRGTWQVEFPGAPARLGGTMRVEPTAAGCTYAVEGQVKVNVPLIGGKAETFIAEMATRLAAREAEVLLSMVSD